MTRCFDTSAWVKLYVAEPGSGPVLAWPRSATPATARLTAVETASAVGRRQRDGSLTEEQANAARQALCADFASLRVVELTPALADAACHLLRAHPLRAADAVHLASALHIQNAVPGSLQFIAFDDRLHAAARAAGLATPAANL